LKQVSVKLALAVTGALGSVPEMPLSPVHAPLAMQLVALVLDQFSVEEAPDKTVVGVADSTTVGNGFTVTLVETDADDPPGPEQLSA
jgi:hypothetical protein